tara:strand:- start:1393 stop:2418 length:1026 start_codon:yes stop_codon:yes gene_type:complete
MSKAAELAKMGEVLTNGQIGGRRNIIINGAMQVAQRATSATFNSSTGDYQTVDRFRFAGNRDQYVATLSQASDSPSGFANSFKVATTTQETSLDADNQLNIQHRLEGQDLQQLKKGTSDAEKLTLSFYVKSSIATTFTVNLVDGDNTRTIASTYTVNVADTWELKTITFAGDTTGTLDNDNARSLDLKFWLDGGTTYTSGTLATSWASSNDANKISATTGFMTTANSTWQITGIQLEVGSTATPFEHRSFGEEFSLCSRYYEVAEAYGNSYHYNDQASSSDREDITATYKVEKRATPTLTVTNQSTGSLSNLSNTTKKATYRRTGSFGSTAAYSVVSEAEL